MKKKRIVSILMVVLVMFSICCLFTGCVDITSESENTKTAMKSSGEIVDNQPAPIDLFYSLERYNVIKRAYWVNGQREKAMSLPCEVEKPLGYIILFSENGSVVGRFVVDGKVSSLNSYLFPAEYPQHIHNEDGGGNCYYDLVEIAGIDGCYGENVPGIFFFTTDGKYIEWTGDFLFSDIPFEVDDPVLSIDGGSK